jgi:hypothetical protein
MKVKTALFIVGGGLGAFALYRYFQKQLALALNWDYKIKYLLPTGVSNNQITFEGIMDIINPSNFELSVNSYDLDFYYQGDLVGNAKSNQGFMVQPDSTFPAPLTFTLDINKTKDKALAILDNVYKQKPVVFGIKGKHHFWRLYTQLANRDWRLRILFRYFVRIWLWKTSYGFQRLAL